MSVWREILALESSLSFFSAEILQGIVENLDFLPRNGHFFFQDCRIL